SRDWSSDVCSSDLIAVPLGKERSIAVRTRAPEIGPRTLTPHIACFQLFAAILFAWLHRRTARTSLAVGAPAHNRGTADLKRTIGVLIEVLPFRIEIGPGETFRSLYDKVAAETLRFLRHAGPGMAEVASGARLDVVLNYISAAFGDFDGRPVRVDWIHSG